MLLQYYSVLHSATPVLLCTTQCYSSTTLYYKVLLCTTQYYSSTTLYYTVLHLIVNKSRNRLPIQWLARGNHDRASCFEKQPGFKLPTTKKSIIQSCACTKNPHPRSHLSTQSFAHRSDNVTPCSSSHLVAVRNDIRRCSTTLGSQSATTHDCSADAVRNDTRQLHITFKVSGQDATN